MDIPISTSIVIVQFGIVIVCSKIGVGGDMG